MNKFENDQQRLQHLAANVRRLMEAANLSIRDVSKGAKVPRSTLSHVLQQQHVPTFGHVCRLAEFFKTSVEALTAAEPMQNGTPNPKAQTLTANGQDRYNPGMSSRTLQPEIPVGIGRKIAQKRLEKGMLQGVLARQWGSRKPPFVGSRRGKPSPVLSTWPASGKSWESPQQNFWRNSKNSARSGVDTV